MAVRKRRDEEDEDVDVVESAPRQSPPRTPLQQKILDALPASIELPEPPASYRAAAWAVTMLTALLPLLYAGLVFLIGHGLYWHFRHNGVWIVSGMWAFLAYWAVYVAGGVTVLFLLKPLLSWNRDRSKPLNIKRSVEPFLYDYVEALCKSLGAPVPRTIQVDLAPNAFAGYRLGFWSLFTRDMTLCIGLPLVLGVWVRQWVGSAWLGRG